ncbi:SDR family oxidoreductase [Phytohabitans houttuyneae]|uniref:Oxidoreductase n=1 Tax=Phytohabitans houttuyneae TaxID=1076126 RepID=A0A6V8KCS1_9ACTN|nr:SDR family oxidoreductase [Phytohabitans houttuyneae]GFJ78515.1 oxidoreductase [Phytohabitans houttuyneae]
MLDGKVLFITGAARGIGEHTARLAAARGATVVLAGLEPDRLAAVAADTGGAWFEADVTDQAALDRAAAGAVERYGRIDAVVANAGIAPRGTIAVGDIEAMAHTVQVNLTGVMRTVGATVEHLIASRGYCLLVSSAAAFAAMPGMAAYCASKAGVEHFGNAIRLELRHRRVSIGTAHMSFVDTDLVRDVQEDLPEFRQTLRKLPWPLGTVTSVEACARAFVDAVERRRRRVYVPKAVGLVQAVRSLMVSPLSDAVIGHGARTGVPKMEEQVRALGRAFGRHGGGR